MSWEKCMETLRQMMTDRGYEKWIDMEEISICSTSDNQHHIMVYLCKSEKFNIESVKYAIYQLQQHRLKHVLIIYQNIITSSAKKAIEHLQDYTMELFEKKELQYNPTRHRLYCPHVRLDKQKMDQAHNLPVLLKSDIISRYFHFHRGDIIQVTRKTGIAYRIVK